MTLCRAPLARWPWSSHAHGDINSNVYFLIRARKAFCHIIAILNISKYIERCALVGIRVIRTLYACPICLSDSYRSTVEHWWLSAVTRLTAGHTRIPTSCAQHFEGRSCCLLVSTTATSCSIYSLNKEHNSIPDETRLFQKSRTD